MLGGGKDREWLRPLTQDGNIDTDDPDLDTMVGCHTGNYTHLNILYPQPGFEYIWERNTGRARAQARQRGGMQVSADDPEMAAMNALMADGPTPMDSSDVFGDVILYKYPVETIRTIRENEQRASEAMMRGGAEDFAERASQLEEQLSRGMPSRFQRRDHGLEFRDGQDRPVDHWKPDDGIIKREG